MRKLLRWIVKALHIKAEPWEVALARQQHNVYARAHQITWARHKERVGDPLRRAASAWGRLNGTDEVV